MRTLRIALLAAVCVIGLNSAAQAQALAPVPSPDHGWDVAVYPVLAWVPLGIGIDVEIPPFGGGDGGEGQIVDSRFDGAFLGGFAASNGTWDFEGYGIWAAFGGDRPERPFLQADIDLIYGHLLVGRRIAPDLFVTAGVRRIALKYDVTLGTLPKASRKPGAWDPLIGIAWHRIRPRFEWHASFDGGGFGVGSDVDLSGQVRVDWKLISHFGLTAGYNILYLKLTDEVLNRPIVVKPTLHGPMAGLGFYF
jgi:hypothetical protein